MKLSFALSLLLILFAGGCAVEDAVEDEDVSMKLICKFNTNALYEDMFTFNKEMTSAFRTSTNSSTPDATYKVTKNSQGYVLNGSQTKIDINKNKTVIPDIDLFILTEGSSNYWNWDLYYFSDFDTDPTRFQACRER